MRQVQHLLWSSLQYEYSEAIAVVSIVRAKLSLFDCLPPLPLTVKNELAFIQAEAIDLKYNQSIAVL